MTSRMTLKATPEFREATREARYQGRSREDCVRVAAIDQKADGILDRASERFIENREAMADREYSRLLRNPDKIDKKFVVGRGQIDVMSGARNQAEWTIYSRHLKGFERVNETREAMIKNGHHVSPKRS